MAEPTRSTPAYVSKVLEDNKGYEAVLTFVLAGVETIIVGQGLTLKSAEQDAARQAVEVYPALRGSSPPHTVKRLRPHENSSPSTRVENSNHVANLYTRLKASYPDPAAKPIPDYYSFQMNGQKGEWETTLSFTLGNGKGIRTVGRGPSKLSSERDAARRALEKTW